jgi:HNH endonuclease
MPRRIPYFKPPWNKPPKGSRFLKVAGAPAGAAEDERKKFYNGAAWRRTRKAFLGTNPICLRCLEGKRGLVAATVVHHKVERLDDPDLAYDMNNLEALCASCHSGIHSSNRDHNNAKA